MYHSILSPTGERMLATDAKGLCWRRLAACGLLVLTGLIAFAQEAQAAPSRKAPTCDGIWHLVVRGDTLGDLSSTHHSSVLVIARVNHIPDPNLIFVGQWLCIPVAEKSASPTSASPSTSGQVAAASAGATPSTQAASSAAPVRVASGGTVSGVKSFIAFVLPYARRASAATGWPVSLILAQWGIEQGWHLPSYTGYNFGNSGPMPGEPTVPGLHVQGSPTAFSYAPTPEDGLRIYVNVAHLAYYAAVAPAAVRGGVDAAARALGASPWDAAHYTATNDPGSWLLITLRTYNLYQYDVR